MASGSLTGLGAGAVDGVQGHSQLGHGYRGSGEAPEAESFLSVERPCKWQICLL